MMPEWMMEATLPNEIDKLDATFSIKIPEVTKSRLDRLPAAYRRRLNERIILLMAHTLHESEFKARDYLTSNNS